LLAPKDPCRILIYFPQKIIQIATRFEIVVLVPPRVAVGAVEQPFGILRAKAELCHNDINPLIGLHESRALFNKGHTITADPVTQSDLFASMFRNTPVAVLGEPALDLISKSLRKRHGVTLLKPWPANGLEMSRPASASIVSQTRFAAAGRVGSIELII